MPHPKTNNSKFVFEFLQELSVSLFCSILFGAGIGFWVAVTETRPMVETVKQYEKSTLYRVKGDE
jgi:hypothetical protein